MTVQPIRGNSFGSRHLTDRVKLRHIPINRLFYAGWNAIENQGFLHNSRVGLIYVQLRYLVFYVWFMHFRCKASTLLVFHWAPCLAYDRPRTMSLQTITSVGLYDVKY